MFRNVLIIALLVLVMLAGLFFYWRNSSPHNVSFSNIPSGVQPADSEFLRFNETGLPEKMSAEVEIVVRPRKAAVALSVKPEGRFACILVEGTGFEKYYELDSHLDAGMFAFLTKRNFATPPFPISRSMSTYRSVAKTAMAFDESRDCMMVLICPQKEWSGLKISLPKMIAPAAAVPSASSPKAGKDLF